MLQDFLIYWLGDDLLAFIVTSSVASVIVYLIFKVAQTILKKDQKDN